MHRPWALTVVVFSLVTAMVEPAAAAAPPPRSAPCPPPPPAPIIKAATLAPSPPPPPRSPPPRPPQPADIRAATRAPSPPPSPRPPSPRPSPSPPLAPSPRSPPSPSPPAPLSLPSLLSPADSRLWGVAGEAWDPRGPLSDWSWAGYHQGQDTPPSPPATLSLKLNYGAVGDGIADDTAAFTRAFEQAPSGAVLYIPRGTYLLTSPVTRYSPLVLRGAGRDQSIIKMNQSFTQLWPGSWDPTDTTAKSPYADGPFFMTFSGFRNIKEATRLGDIVMDAKKGDTFIQVLLSKPNATLIQLGDMIRITASDINLSLINYLNGGIQLDPGISNDYIMNSKQTYQFLSPVKSVRVLSASTKGMTVQVELSRPLALDVLPSIWRDTQMHRGLEYTMFESGVEDLSFVFPPTPYPGHEKEMGYNAFLMMGCSSCWVRRLGFTNNDLGLDLQSSAFTTVDDIMFNGVQRLGKHMPVGYGAGWLSAHHHVRLSRDQDCRVQNILINAAGVHDITLTWYATLNVYHNIVSSDLSLDFHGCVPTANLLSNSSCGACTRVWYAGRSQTVGAHAGVLNTIWGMRGSETNNFTAAPLLFGSNITYVGVNLANTPTWNNVVVDMVVPRMLMPRDLAAAMLARRQAASLAASVRSLL